MGEFIETERETLENRLRYLGVQAIALEHRKTGYVNALRKTNEELLANELESYTICQRLKETITFEGELT